MGQVAWNEYVACSADAWACLAEEWTCTAWQGQAFSVRLPPPTTVAPLEPPQPHLRAVRQRREARGRFAILVGRQGNVAGQAA